jgi:predicted HTH transcriptional regulator
MILQESQTVEFKESWRDEHLKTLEIPDKVIREAILNSIYQELTGVSKRTATNDLAKLVKNLVFEKQGSSSKNVKYLLMGQQ